MRAASELTESLGGSAPASPSGVLHEGRKRADRSLGGSAPGSPSGVLHEGRKRADRIARGLGAWNLKKVRPTRATSEPTVHSGARHQRTNEGYQPIYKNISSNLVN